MFSLSRSLLAHRITTALPNRLYASVLVLQIRKHSETSTMDKIQNAADRMTGKAANGFRQTDVSKSDLSGKVCSTVAYP